MKVTYIIFRFCFSVLSPVLTSIVLLGKTIAIGRVTKVLESEAPAEQ